MIFAPQVSLVVVLVGAAPDLEFLETDTQLGQVPGNPIDKNNPIDIGKACPQCQCLLQ
jgi:hypothetical protein